MPRADNIAYHNTEAVDLKALMEVAYKYYPRWYPKRESLEAYLVGYDRKLEFWRLVHFIERATEDNTRWHELLRAVKAAFPEHWVDDGRPPSWEIPSYQLVLEYKHGAGSRLVNFRLSFFVPFYDYYETERDKDGILVWQQLHPSPESAPIVEVIEREIHERFGYRKLDPELGETLVPEIGIDTALPGEVTLAGALFEIDRRW